MKPQLITENFLSPQECQHVFERVLHYRSQWFDIKDSCIPPVPGVDTSQHRASFFGPSVYSLYKDLPRYQKLNSIYNSILFNEFKDIYVRIKDAISDTLGIDTYYCDGVSYPGFHTFGPGLPEQTVNYDYFHVHQDLYPNILQGIVPYGEIFSFIIPVKLPRAGGHLNYNGSNVYTHTLGALSYWPGIIHHKIGNFVLTGEDDIRITWQMHVAVSNNKGIIFW